MLDAEIYDQIRETARRFAADVVKPAANDLDRDEAFPADIYRQMGALGLFGITVPEEHGGAGLDTYAYSIVMEELSRGYSSVADQCGLVELIGTLLTRYGTPDQLKRLPDILTGKTRVAYCLTEAEAGSDLSNVRTTARETAEGYVIDGGKLWIHNAPVADLGFVLASTDPAAGHRGMSIFLVDLHAPGVSRGPKEHKMGQRASQVGALTFDGVTVPREALLGPKGRGFHIMMSVLEKGRVGIASLAVGIAQAGLEAALGYARDRRQFGKPILDNQGLQWLLADMAKDIAAARALVERAALLIDHEKPATSASSMAKCFASDMAVAQTANAVQVFGGSGYIRGFEVERLYRDAKITQIYEGTNQIQRTIIARELVKNGA
ncbi:acyl-CoA dehydrogenase family protein [Bosea sp. (in: a-proteobacteria)]|uniref:acyl-CoA dehydrogenase family protein n=1 Tax=Bosea sp. (in: a-proteobacteria) TaxID=1871050 RepID=UPI001ACC97B4|nr:acyl-CoA dehydrogenase family protein [Bosea sp. (in: a-proteobacteria)]